MPCLIPKFFNTYIILIWMGQASLCWLRSPWLFPHYAWLSVPPLHPFSTLTVVPGYFLYNINEDYILYFNLSKGKVFCSQYITNRTTKLKVYYQQSFSYFRLSLSVARKYSNCRFCNPITEWQTHTQSFGLSSEWQITQMAFCFVSWP
jgi:hypothetical protein